MTVTLRHGKTGSAALTMSTWKEAVRRSRFDSRVRSRAGRGKDVGDLIVFDLPVFTEVSVREELLNAASRLDDRPDCTTGVVAHARHVSRDPEQVGTLTAVNAHREECAAKQAILMIVRTVSRCTAVRLPTGSGPRVRFIAAGRSTRIAGSRHRGAPVQARRGRS